MSRIHLYKNTKIEQEILNGDNNIDIYILKYFIGLIFNSDLLITYCGDISSLIHVIGRLLTTYPKQKYNLEIDNILQLPDNVELDNLIDELKKEYELKKESDKKIFFLDNKTINKLRKPFKNIKVDTILKLNKIKNFKNVFNLSITELQIILYCYFITRINMSDIFCPNLSNKDIINVICENPDIHRITQDLFDKGFVLSNYELNYAIYSIFYNYCTTENEIIEQVTNKQLIPNLTKDNFSYMKTELDYCRRIICNALKSKKIGVNILLYGIPGTGKTEFAKLISKYPMYEVNFKDKRDEELDKQNRLHHLNLMLSLLQDNNKVVILLDEAEDILNKGWGENGHSCKAYTNRLLENNSIPIIWTTNNIEDVDPAFLRRMTYCVEFKELSEETRLSIWKTALKENDFKVPIKKIKELNKQYEVVPSIITNAIQTTKLIKGDVNDFEGLIDSIAKVTYKKHDIKKKGEDNKLTNYDISLLNTDLDLDDLTNKIVNCNKLNFSLCLYGEPGTGKSLYARYLADKLGLKVIQKRVSDLISCLVGQSEQNIADAFRQANDEKALLIFDEADSFLQNRGTAHNQWEITQVNEMLTQMESHKYPFVCTTNLLDTLDEASLRRFTFKVKFDFMNSEMVEKAMKNFFNLNSRPNIKGLTPGDFATVKKKIDFLNITDETEIVKYLQQEVKLKQSKTLKNTIGF